MMVTDAPANKNLTTKRKDPNYSPITAHIPKPLARRLRMYCTEYEKTIAETVEKAIEAYLNDVNYPEVPDRGHGR